MVQHHRRYHRACHRAAPPARTISLRSVSGPALLVDTSIVPAPCPLAVAAAGATADICANALYIHESSVHACERGTAPTDPTLLDSPAGRSVAASDLSVKVRTWRGQLRPLRHRHAATP